MHAFRHVERDRTIVFGPDALGGGRDLLPERFTLLSTARAAGSVPGLAERAAAVVLVPAGQVDALAADLRGRVGAGAIVALGGGRVIDVAKAIAAAERIADVIAVPTSLSGAEMTRVHRHARGVDAGVPRVRPTLVLHDPRLSASLPVPGLAASSANALAHAAAATTNPGASPLAAAVGRDAIRRMARAWPDRLPNGAPDSAVGGAAGGGAQGGATGDASADGARFARSGATPDRDGVALAALLAGWAVDLGGLGPHHALAQTVVRGTGLPHADVNAALLPHTVRALRGRAGAALETVDADLGAPLEDLAVRLRSFAGAGALPELVADPDRLERLVATAAARAEVRRLSPAMDAAEIRALYAAAAG